MDDLDVINLLLTLALILSLLANVVLALLLLELPKREPLPGLPVADVGSGRSEAGGEDIECPTCKGHSVLPSERGWKCLDCKGTGRIPNPNSQPLTDEGGVSLRSRLVSGERGGQ